MGLKSLEDLVREAGGALNFLRAEKYDRADLPPEFNPGLIIPQVPEEW